MRLSDLNPSFVGHGGDGVTDAEGKPIPRREGIGIELACPCGCDRGLFVAFRNPLDGGPPLHDERHLWERTGDTFDAMTLRPSILRAKEKGGCGWHGFITAGEVTTCP